MCIPCILARFRTTSSGSAQILHPSAVSVKAEVGKKKKKKWPRRDASISTRRRSRSKPVVFFLPPGQLRAWMQRQSAWIYLEIVRLGACFHSRQGLYGRLGHVDLHHLSSAQAGGMRTDMGENASKCAAGGREAARIRARPMGEAVRTPGLKWTDRSEASSREQPCRSVLSARVRRGCRGAPPAPESVRADIQGRGLNPLPVGAGFTSWTQQVSSHMWLICVYYWRIKTENHRVDYSEWISEFIWVKHFSSCILPVFQWKAQHFFPFLFFFC